MKNEISYSKPSLFFCNKTTAIVSSKAYQKIRKSFLKSGLINVDQKLSLMSTQAEPGATPILHENFGLPNYYIMGQ